MPRILLLALVGVCLGNPCRAGEPLRDFLDAQISAAWKREKITPAGPADDAVFLRRVYLDLVGTIPSADEARTYLDDTSKDKRARLIDRLLADPRFAEHQADVWDLALFGRDAPESVRRRDDFRNWLIARFKNNDRYDQIVRQILLGEQDGSQAFLAQYRYRVEDATEGGGAVAIRTGEADGADPSDDVHAGEGGPRAKLADGSTAGQGARDDVRGVRGRRPGPAGGASQSGARASSRYTLQKSAMQAAEVPPSPGRGRSRKGTLPVDPATELLARLRGQGFTVRLSGDKVNIVPASKLSPEDLEAARAHKDRLLELLQAAPTAPAGGAKSAKAASGSNHEGTASATARRARNGGRGRASRGDRGQRDTPHRPAADGRRDAGPGRARRCRVTPLSRRPPSPKRARGTPR